MHVAPRCGLRWYNFTILISRDHISREGTIQTFLFHGLFLAIFLSNPILWVSHSHRLISWQSSRSILLWTLWRLTRGHGVITSRHITCHTPGSDQDSITPVTALMTRSPRQSNGNLTRSASKKSNPQCYFPFQCSSLWKFWHTSWCDWSFKDGSEEKPQALNVSH